MLTLDQLSSTDIRRRLQGQDGLRLRMGPFVAQIETRLADVTDAVAALYASYPVADDEAFVDFQVSVRMPPGLRRWSRPQVTFGFDGQEPFNPLPGDQGFPLLEWGLNWCVYANCHQYLILHAAVLERGGRALILPAPSGSGKSTLCAALLFGGWRLLSDELALICPATGQLIPHPRPVSLKNDSIDVISRFAPDVRFGSRVAETVKGVVAHFAAPPDAILKSNEPAMPAWVVLPKYAAGRPATLQPLDKAQGFMQLVQNAFNYEIFGLEGFRLLGSVMDRCECFTFEYSRVPEAVELFACLADTPATARR